MACRSFMSVLWKDLSYLVCSFLFLLYHVMKVEIRLAKLKWKDIQSVL
mgnify:CR=1 FL=1